ncbi:MAG: hypothetical protein H6559_34255 [Lewinellaceae bacterium]|nr:hypothetical protein [Lewinellaceae bacterium]
MVKAQDEVLGGGAGKKHVYVALSVDVDAGELGKDDVFRRNVNGFAECAAVSRFGLTRIL